MATTNTPASFPGLFKDVYNDSLAELVPNFAVLQKEIPLRESELTGNAYIMGVILAKENGFSYGPSSGPNTLLTLNASIAGFIGQARVEGYQTVLRSRLDYPSASKAAQKGKRAIEDAYGALVENMATSARFRIEASFLYGQDGLGVVSVVSGSTMSITAASWAPGIWAGGEGAVLECWSTNAASATQRNGDMPVTAIDMTNKVLTTSGTISSVQAGDILYFKGTRTSTGYNECAGLNKIITNTGTLFNIDASAYSLWQGTSYPVNGAISLAEILVAANQAVGRGLMEDAAVLLSPKSFAVLNTAQSALRQFDSSYNANEAKNGTKGLVFHSTNGLLEVMSHPMVKEGEAFVVPMKRVKRVGSTDITNGLGDQELVVQVSDQNAYEIRLFSDQALFIDAPAQCVKLTGITYP